MCENLHFLSPSFCDFIAEGDQFSLSPDSDDPSTQWKFDDSGTRVVDAAGNVLDIQGGFTADGVAVVSWEDKNQNNQRWNKVVV